MNVVELLGVAVSAFAGVVLPVGVLCFKAARWFDQLGAEVKALTDAVEGHGDAIAQHEHRLTVLETKET